MSVKWKSSKAAGVRFYEHGTRRHGVKYDRYFAIRYQIKGERREEGLGWASEGWSEKRAAEELAQIKKAARTGEGPVSLRERRDLAEEKRKAKEAERKRKERDSLTFGQFWKESYFPQAQRDKTEGTWKREASFYNKWLEPLANVALKEISPIHLERIKSKMSKAGGAPRSIAYCLDVVRQVFNTAKAQGAYFGDSPTAKVKKPKVDNRRLRFLKKDEAQQLLEALARKSRSLHDMALISLQCGLRAGELFGLKWADVDLDLEIMTLWDTKSGKTRSAYLTTPAVDVLRARQFDAGHELVFPSPSGGRREKISRSFGKVVTELGLNDGKTDRREKVVFHTLRHTFASWLVMDGTPLYTVGKLLGHSTSAMTERYSHLAPDHMRDAVKALESAIGQDKQEVRALAPGE